MLTHKSEVVERMSAAWSLAKMKVQKAQQQQKQHHDRHAHDPRFKVEDQVFIHMPSEQLVKAYKFARPFKGPYRVVSLFENGMEVLLISKSHSDTIQVALN